MIATSPDAAIQHDRLATLDVIRGVAVLGILLMNVVAFAMPDAAYMNPAAYGGAHGLDLVTWTIEFVLVDGKMRGLFSWLFGASLLLVADRAEAAGRSPAAVHYARMATLAVFGFAHLVLVWWGDILLHYALVGSVAFLFRRQRPHQLVAMGIVLVLAQTSALLPIPFGIEHARMAVTAAQPSPADLALWRATLTNFGVPPPDVLASDLALHRGPWWPLVVHRWAAAPELIVGTLRSDGFETLAYMLFGMAGLRTGLLAGTWPDAAYCRWAVRAMAVSLPLYALLAADQIAAGFTPAAIGWAAVLAPTSIRPVMILGWACLLARVAHRGGPLVARLGAAGRMAFSNYLGTSLVATTLFYGYGLGWYGRLGRAALLPVVAAIWAVMLLWSRPWLARFRFGPLEWWWRSLARGRIQPFRGPAR